MTGENRWRAGDHGLQDARKGVRFVELPPVLQVRNEVSVRSAVSRCAVGRVTLGLRDVELLWADWPGIVGHFLYLVVRFCADGELTLSVDCGTGGTGRSIPTTARASSSFCAWFNWLARFCYIPVYLVFYQKLFRSLVFP